MNAMRFLHAYLGAWLVVLCPWVLLLEAPAEKLDMFPAPEPEEPEDPYGWYSPQRAEEPPPGGDDQHTHSHKHPLDLCTDSGATYRHTHSHPAFANSDGIDHGPDYPAHAHAHAGVGRPFLGEGSI